MSRQNRPRSRPARHPVQAAAALAGLLVAATGCSSQDQASPSAAGTAPAPATSPASATLDPCALLAPTTLDSLTGGHADHQGPALPEANGRACHWRLPDAGSLGAGELVVTAWHGREFYLPDTIGNAVPGIADEAQADRSLGMVLFRSGEDVVATHVLAFPDKELAFDVARAIAERL